MHSRIAEKHFPVCTWFIHPSIYLSIHSSNSKNFRNDYLLIFKFDFLSPVPPTARRRRPLRISDHHQPDRDNTASTFFNPAWKTTRHSRVARSSTPHPSRSGRAPLCATAAQCRHMTEMTSSNADADESSLRFIWKFDECLMCLLSSLFPVVCFRKRRQWQRCAHKTKHTETTSGKHLSLEPKQNKNTHTQKNPKWLSHMRNMTRDESPLVKKAVTAQCKCRNGSRAHRLRVVRGFVSMLKIASRIIIICSMAEPALDACSSLGRRHSRRRY